MKGIGWWALAGGVVSLLVALALFDPYLFTGGDNAAYYALARALATGRGYVDLIAPGTPGETVYPPGYPLLLVPFYWLFGGSMTALKLESLVAGLAVLWAVWMLARRDPGVPGWAAAGAVWLTGLAPVFLTYTHWVLSDMSFTAVAMITLVLFQRATQPGEKHRGDSWSGWWLAGCLAALFAFAVRTAGVALLAAPIAWALLRRQWRRAGAGVAVAAVGAVPWLVWTARRPPSTGGYFEQATASNRLDPGSAPLQLADLVERGWDNLVHYATLDFPQLFWPSAPVPVAVRAFGLAIGGALLAYGAWRLVRSRGLTVWGLYALATAAILLAWPWTGDRFFLTLAPLVWIVLLTGLDGAARLVAGGPRPAAALSAVLAAVLLLGALRTIPAQWRLTRAWLDGREFAGYDPFWQDYFQASRWIGDTAPDAVIAARKPTFAWYFSGRPTVVYPFHRDPERTWRFLRETGVTHIVLDPLTRDFLAPALAPHIDRLEIVHAAPHRIVLVLRLAPGE